MREVWREAKKEKWAYVFLAVPLLLLIVFYLLPILWALGLSFLSYHPARTVWVGLDNFTRMLRDDIYWLAARNTVVYTLFTVIGGLALSLALSAIIFNLKRRSVQTFFKASFYLPAVASGVAISLVWLWLYQPSYGLFNFILSQVRVPPQTWLANPDLVLGSIIFMSLASGHGAAIVLLTAAMGSIPESIYEAARIDGAGRIREFWSITVPLLRPTILYLLIIGMIGSMQVFTQIYVMTNGGPGYASVTMVFRIFRTAFESLDFGLASAQSVLLFLFLSVGALVTYRFLGSEVEY